MAAAVESSYNGHNTNAAINPSTTAASSASSRVPPTTVPEDNIGTKIASEESEIGAKDSEAVPEVDIVINNVVCSFSVRCHLNLRDIALRGRNVEYRKENGMVTMKLRRPYTTASMWSSGKVTCTGANSEEQARIAARRYARVLQKLGFKVRFKNFRVVNVLGTCTLPFGVKIANFSQAHREASYEPELHPGVTYKLYHPKATLKIFSTGSVTVTAPCVRNVQLAIEHIFPLVHEYKKPKTLADIKHPLPETQKSQKTPKRKRSESSYGNQKLDSDAEGGDHSDEDDE